jgi:hypothetical protein
MKKLHSARIVIASLVLLSALMNAISVKSLAISPLLDLTLELDGNDDYASASDQPSLDLGVGSDFTIESFIYVQNPERQDSDIVVWKNGAYGLSILYESGELKDRIVFQINTSPLETKLVFYNLYMTAGWHHLAAVFDNEYTPGKDLLAIFLDGKLVATEEDLNTTGIPDTAFPINIGANAGTNSVKGWLEEVRLSSTVRYSGTTYLLPDKPFIPDANTSALWHFDEAWDVTVFSDASINQNTLYGNNGAQIGNPTGIIPVVLPFDKVSPVDQTSEAGNSTILTWETSAGASGYQVCLETDNNEACDNGWIEVGSQIYYAPDLDAYTQYKWQVRAYNAVSTADANAGQWWSFKTEDLAQPAPEYTVTLTSDEDNGLCGIKHCSLREAFSAAQADGESSTIYLQSSARYSVINSISDTTWGSTAFPAVSEELSIFGNWSTIERDPSLICRVNGDEEVGEFRLFHISETGNLKLHKMLLQYGCSDLVSSTSLDSGYGGAILNRGSLSTDHVTVISNQANQGGGGLANWTNAAIEIAGSTIARNFSVKEGGGIDNAGNASIVNTTLSGNLTAYTGGGISNLSMGNLTLIFVTIAENSAGDSGGGLANQTGGILKLQNSILGGNIDIDQGTPDCAGSVTSLGYNLVQDTTGCSMSAQEHDLLDQNPWLIALSFAYQSTPVHSLWVVSPAIDLVPSDENGCGSSIAMDQRGLLRPLDADLDGLASCDIGAVEMEEGSVILKYIYFAIITK